LQLQQQQGSGIQKNIGKNGKHLRHPHLPQTAHNFIAVQTAYVIKTTTMLAEKHSTVLYLPRVTIHSPHTTKPSNSCSKVRIGAVFSATISTTLSAAAGLTSASTQTSATCKQHPSGSRIQAQHIPHRSITGSTLEQCMMPQACSAHPLSHLTPRGRPGQHHRQLAGQQRLHSCALNCTAAY